MGRNGDAPAAGALAKEELKRGRASDRRGRSGLEKRTVEAMT
jgi:hypothetical protein